MVEYNTSIDIAEKETVTLKQASDILGLKYHTARKILHNELSIGSINYGCKTVWIKEDILNYKRRCYIAPKPVSAQAQFNYVQKQKIEKENHHGSL